jgi:hypothetical protein
MNREQAEATMRLQGWEPGVIAKRKYARRSASDRVGCYAWAKADGLAIGSTVTRLKKGQTTFGIIFFASSYDVELKDNIKVDDAVVLKIYEQVVERESYNDP